MSKVHEIETALQQLAPQEQWEVARWLLDNLDKQAGERPDAQVSTGAGVASLPDYGGRRRRIFGDKVLPNMVLVARSEERW